MRIDLNNLYVFIYLIVRQCRNVLIGHMVLLCSWQVSCKIPLNTEVNKGKHLVETKEEVLVTSGYTDDGPTAEKIWSKS